MTGNKKSAFTFLELLIVISLMLLLLTFVYIPYSHYQDKIKVRQVAREASQSILEWRNLAINGYDEERGEWIFENRSIGIYFENSDSKKETIYFYSYPYGMNPIWAFPEENTDVTLIKERKLPTGTQFDIAQWDKNNMFFFFEAISWRGSYYVIDWSWTKVSVIEDTISLGFSFKWSTSSVLQKEIKYDTRVNIIDF